MSFTKPVVPPRLAVHILIWSWSGFECRDRVTEQAVISHSFPIHPWRDPGSRCAVYFTLTRGINTAHIVNSFALGCHVFFEKLNIRKTNPGYLHFYHVQHSFPFCSVSPGVCLSFPSPLRSTICLAGQAPMAANLRGFACQGKYICLSFLKGVFHWGWSSRLKGFNSLCQHHEKSTAVCQGSDSSWREVLCTSVLAPSGTEFLPVSLEEFYLITLFSVFTLTSLYAVCNLFILLRINSS